MTSNHQFEPTWCWWVVVLLGVVVIVWVAVKWGAGRGDPCSVDAPMEQAHCRATRHCQGQGAVKKPQ